MKKVNQYVVPKYIYLMWTTLLFAFAFGVYRQEWSTVFVSLATLIISIYSVWLSHHIKFRIPASLTTAAIIFIYATLFLGEVGGFYERFWWWDVVLHTGSAIGFGLIGAIILILLSRKGTVKADPILTAFFVFSFTVTIGVVWEIFEFAMDQLFGLHMQKSGLIDTMADLIVDSLGGLLAAGASYAYLTKRRVSALTKVLKEGVDENKRF